MPKFWTYRGGELQTSTGHSVGRLARKYGTPLFVYDRSIVVQRMRELRSAFGTSAHVHFAIKSNFFIPMVELLRDLGCGIDAVSGGEIKRALDCGFAPEQIVFSGVGKTRGEILGGLQEGVRTLNVESLQELQRVAELARSLRRVAPVLIRVNPDLDVRTHRSVRTGHGEDKFGIALGDLPQAIQILRSSRELELRGLAFHLGSQLFTSSIYLRALRKVRPVYLELFRQGFPLTYLDMGGGFGVDYKQRKTLDLQSLGRQVKAELKGWGKELGTTVELILEPGRFLVAEAGLLVTEVQYVKQAGRRRLAILDTGMHNLMRPMLYSAFHDIQPVKQSNRAPKQRWDLVGPICESTDIIGEKRLLPEIQQGDLLAVFHAGAYGSSMASDYNLRGKPAEILV